VQTSYNEGLITDIDHEVAEIAQSLFRQISKYSGARLDRMRKTIIDSKLLFKVLLSLSDQQMVTGFAMLTVGLVQIDSITEYHFAIVQNLSILSFVVHDTTAVILQDEVVRHRMMRHWRGVVVVGSMLITIAIQLPDGHYYAMEDYGLPVKCIWTSMKGNYRPQSSEFWLMIMWMAILSFSLMETLCVYFPNAFGRLMDNSAVEAATCFIMEKVLAARDTYEFRTKRQQCNVLDRSLTLLARYTAICIFAISEVLHSQAFGLQLWWMVMINSINYIFYLRNTASDNGRHGDEDEWGFGQAVPMFLLILPIATVVESAWSKFPTAFVTSAPTDRRIDAFKRPGSFKSMPVQDGLLATIPISTLFAPNAQEPILRTARFEGAGYYFGYSPQSRTWDMEKWLYDQSLFKSMLLVALAGSFGCSTVLGFVL
jgi:hypothetical protein